MNKRIFAVTLLAAITSSTSLVAAEGWYLSVGGGANHVEDDSIRGTFTQEVEYDFGYVGKGAVGYQYENGLRSEFELSYRNNDLDTIAANRATGDISSYSAMLNVLYDFDISETGLDTYVGIGAGLSYIDMDSVTPVGFGFSALDDSDTTPAFQGIVGVSYDVANATELYANYNYFYAPHPDFSDVSGSEYETDYNNSTIVVGLKFNMFDTPEPIVEPATMNRPIIAEPAPMPAPAPIPEPEPAPVSRTYLVFFDFDRSSLTKEAVSILRQAAADAQAGNAVAIEVVGHADRAGTDKYNMVLSERRARAVRIALEKLNIPGQHIHTMAKGESDPLVPTEDGVREPQNRRVEIMYMITPN